MPGATLYSLRHGFVTEALYANVPIVTVAKSCGTSVQMIEATYAHAMAERDVEVWSALGTQLRVVGAET
ncbi:hypothetical protein [Falsiruegeria mediterranea]|uniref:hypothetical protein n=1 Tax=Falsiruegeria mediterranea TaxID=1280832 RepID=UPI000D553FA0|nr:hypothetical protein [Falsiruegeria mediterranea]